MAARSTPDLDSLTNPHDRPTSMDAIHQRVQERLVEADQRYTAGRRRLVELLVKAGRPVTLPELATMGPDLPQSSMYRNLDVLERTGLTRRIAVGSEHSRFELAEPILGHHHHMICVGCGTIEDIRLSGEFEEQLDAALESAAAESRFKPLNHSLDLHGRCAKCV